MDDEYDFELILLDEYEGDDEPLTIDLPFYTEDDIEEMIFFTEEELQSLMDTTESF